jgi:hypothetical protein
MYTDVTSERAPPDADWVAEGWYCEELETSALELERICSEVANCVDCEVGTRIILLEDQTPLLVMIESL